MASPFFPSFLLLTVLLCGYTTGQTFLKQASLTLNEADGLVDLNLGDFLEFDLGLANLSEFTLEFWAAQRLGSSQAAAPQQTVFFFGTDANQNFVWVRGNNGSGTVADSTARILADINGVSTGVLEVPRKISVWVHFSFTFGPEGCTVAFHQNVDVPSTMLNLPTILWTQFPAATRAVLGSSLPPAKDGSGLMSAKLSEFRVWNTSKTQEEISIGRFSSLNGDEPGLLNYWRFDLDTVDIAGGSELIAPNARFADPVFNYTAFQNTKQLPLSNIFRKIDFDQPIAFPFLGGDVYGNTDPFVTLVTHNVFGLLCFRENSSLCSEFGVGETKGLDFRSFALLEYTPDRDACGTTQSFAVRIDALDSLPASVELQISSFAASLVPVSPILLGTEGGPISFSGVLGIDGFLGTTESVVLTIQPGDEVVNCSDPTVSGGVLSCNVVAGVGTTADLTLTVCGQQVSLTNVFSFEGPNVTVIQGLTFVDLQISGKNFGPSRNINPASLTDRVLINGTIPCTIQNITHDQINCFVDEPLGNQQPYSISIVIGGQPVASQFQFAVCSPPCVNGAPCVGSNQCDCTGLPYEGPTCAAELECAPRCKNNGQCILGSDGLGKSCSCPEGFQGRDCGTTVGKAAIGMIIGIVAAVVVVIVILSIVIIVLIVKRPEKRHGANFIPLDKKDFTKIIYGDQLTQSPDKNAGDIKQLEKLLVQDDLKLAFTVSHITQITEADKIAKALIVVFQDNGQVLNLLKAFIQEEVSSTDSAGTLFRSNSMVSKMFKFYSRLIGLPYLYETIGPELNKLIEEELGLEVDPEKMEEGKDLDEMRWALMSQSQKILKQILVSDERCPTQFRELFAHIKQCVSERFPDNVNTTIGGFIFLRFFCPAVSSPEAYGIVEEPPSADSRRLLILITKVLQNLSNDVEFGSKEPYMTKMNDFIHANRMKLATFYEKLMKPSTKPEVTCELPKNIKAVSLGVLSNHIRDNLAKIEDPALKEQLQQAVEQ